MREMIKSSFFGIFQLYVGIFSGLHTQAQASIILVSRIEFLRGFKESFRKRNQCLVWGGHHEKHLENR